MITRAERLRRAAALAGPALFLGSSLMPLFGGGARRRARCESREFTGEFDDCFNDYLPILELLVPIAALAFAWMFARFSFALWAPDPDERTRGWRLASSSPAADHWPILHAVAAVGVAWSVWRGATYLFALSLWPYAVFWFGFAAWFAAGLFVAWPRTGADDI